MSVSDVVDHLAEGQEALRSARWVEARDAFEASLADSASPEAMDGLGRALWWMGETGEALATRARAYSAYRKSGRVDEAARIAIWLGLEHAASPGHEAIAGGWLGRAERLLDGASSSGSGWLALARSGLETDPVRMADYADEALSTARVFGDAELEIRALAKSGLALVRSGRVDEGMVRLDEAMAAASAGEAEKPETFAETCCDMVAACEAALDGRRLEQWGRVAEQFLEVRPYPPLLSFCGSCCAGVFAARGDLASAERWLIWTIEKLENGGHEVRCVDPRARLAELRISQGRFEEAERLLSGIETRPESIRPVVALHVERGELAPAASVLHRWLRKLGADSLGAVPFLSMLVTVQIARGDLNGALSSALSIERLAKRAGVGPWPKAIWQLVGFSSRKGMRPRLSMRFCLRLNGSIVSRCGSMRGLPASIWAKRSQPPVRPSSPSTRSEPPQPYSRRLGPSVRLTGRMLSFDLWVNEGESVPRVSGD